MKSVISVSLGNSQRDKKVITEILGEKILLKRIGTDGNFEAAKATLEKYDGKVNALTLGGIDLYLWLGKTKYRVRDAERLIENVRKTPVVDGSGIKNSLERRIAQFMQENGLPVKSKKVLLVRAVDRYAMAESFYRAGAELTIGDLIFTDIANWPLSWTSFHSLARIVLPFYVKKPFQELYPTGKKQAEIEPQPHKTKYYNEADIIAGDFHFIRRRMPADLNGKIVVTNTTTEGDVYMLQVRNAKCLVTTTPRFQGRSFGANVIDGLVVALYGKRPEELAVKDYLTKLDEIGFKPRIEYLNK